MKNLLRYIWILGIFTSCTKGDVVNSSDVISNLTISNRAPLADGTTLVYLSATLNPNTDAGKTGVIFEASGGKFLPAGSSDTLITQNAMYVNGVLTATVTLRMPMMPTKINISATPATASAITSYVLRDFLNVQTSAPATLQLTPSALSIKQNFMSELTLTALLKNSIKNPVSTGYQVQFKDYYPNGNPVGGSFRALRDTTDATSTATTAYALGPAQVNTSFYIKCTLLDAAGKPTSVKDSCLVTINQ